MWLGSWRGRRGDLVATAAAAAGKADPAAAKQQESLLPTGELQVSNFVEGRLRRKVVEHGESCAFASSCNNCTGRPAVQKQPVDTLIR